MFSIGIFELLILLSLALIVLGPKKFPQLAKDLARLIHQLRSIKADVQQQVSNIKDHSAMTTHSVHEKFLKNDPNSSKLSNKSNNLSEEHSENN